MQWDAGPNAGFAPEAARPWLPVHPKSSMLNVEAERRDPQSILNCYRQLLALRRQEPALQAGTLQWLDNLGLPDAVVAYRRVREGASRHSVDVFLNFSRREVELDLSVQSKRQLFSSRGCTRRDVPRTLRLAAHEGVVLFDPA
jgi:alpha-glucosidase